MTSLTHNGNINCGSFTNNNNWCCGRQKTVNCYTLAKNTNSKLVNFEALLIKIWKHKKFLFNVMRARKMARDYRNKNKNFCISYNMSAVSCGEGKLTMYLNYNGCNSPENLTVMNFNKYSFLTRVVSLLPSVWSISAQNTPLQKNEIILKDFIENADFFTKLFSSFNFSTSNYNAGKEYCKVFKVPGFLSSNCLPYKVKLEGDELRMLQCMLLRGVPSMKTNAKLPYFNNDIEGCECQ